MRESRTAVRSGADDNGSATADRLAMYARVVDDSASRLRQLRLEEWEDLSLGALAFAASLAATQRLPSLAIPLFIGGVVSLGLGVRALWRHWDLVDRLCDQPDAYVIPEIRARAERETTMTRRRSSAVQLRSWVRDPGPESAARVAEVADELSALISELEDPELRLDPIAGVACMRLLTDIESSPLLNPKLPADDLGSRIFQIRHGLRKSPQLSGECMPSARLQP
jgi:hypothetical protein